jgi:CSLREA domain-containing protein
LDAIVAIGLVSLSVWLLPARSVRADVIIIVDTAADVIANDGACSLREAITAANNNGNYFNCIGNGGGYDLRNV